MRSLIATCAFVNDTHECSCQSGLPPRVTTSTERTVAARHPTAIPLTRRRHAGLRRRWHVVQDRGVLRRTALGSKPSIRRATCEGGAGCATAVLATCLCAASQHAVYTGPCVRGECERHCRTCFAGNRVTGKSPKLLKASKTPRALKEDRPKPECRVPSPSTQHHPSRTTPRYKGGQSNATNTNCSAPQIIESALPSDGNYCLGPYFDPGTEHIHEAHPLRTLAPSAKGPRLGREGGREGGDGGAGQLQRGGHRSAWQP